MQAMPHDWGGASIADNEGIWSSAMVGRPRIPETCDATLARKDLFCMRRREARGGNKMVITMIKVTASGQEQKEALRRR